MVTATSSTYVWGDELTAKLREFVATNPIEQSQLGNRFLDVVETRHDMTITDAGKLQFPVSFIEAAQGDYYDNWDQTSSGVSNDLTMAEETMYSITEPVLLSRAERRRNNGRALFKLLAHRTRQAMLRSRNKLNEDMQASAQATGANGASGPIPTQLLFPEDGGNSSTALHGIRGDQNTGWQNQFVDVSGALASNFDKLDDIVEDCRKYGLNEPSYLLTTQALKNGFKAAARSSHGRIDMSGSAQGRLADLGFNGVTWEGMPVIADRHCLAQSIYVMTDDAVVHAEDPMDNWTIEGPFPAQVNNQHGDKWNVYKSGQLLSTERGACGHAFNIT